MREWSAILFAIFMVGSSPALAQDNLVGSKAPEWIVSGWLNSPPLSLSDLSGSVTLVRWWTAPYCPYCAASSGALNEWYATYRDRGFQVVGLYHHKSGEPLDRVNVENYVRRLGFRFPVAIDDNWKTLKTWWLDRTEQPLWTSVTFLIDRQGVIRTVHPGGKYIKGDPDYSRMQADIELLLRE